MEKIKMTTPLVEMDGDEMTRVLWQLIKDELLTPFVDLNTEYYDLGLVHRNETNDQVTIDSAEATKKYGVAVKCATITPNAARVKEYDLKEMYKSPNGTIRALLDGTVFRAPIIVKGIEPYVKTWKKPITIARHAYGDVYKASEMKVPGAGKAELVFTAEDGTQTKELIHEFKGAGVLQGMHNLNGSIESFARSCFNFALETKQDLWFATKDTISKKYDHTFKDIFQEVYDNDYKAKFEEAGITYFYTLIDDAVARVLRLKYRLGLFDNPYWDIKKYDKFGSKEFAAVALQATEESEVLLKNDAHTLPIAKGKKILLTGPNANSMRCLNGGWSYSWQGHVADEYAQAYHTIYEALCEKYGKENIIYEPGVTYAPYKNDNWWEENKPEIEKPVAAAAQADIIIACIGENSYCETPGNLTDLTLSENQRNLVKALAATGKPIVLVLNQGRPRIINDIEPLAKAVVNIMLPSNYGGDALANLLAGDANFSGKMPFTYPRLINALATYDFKPCENIGQMGGNYNYDSVMDIQWPFGFGLSYTNYEYSNLKVNKPTFNADDELIFTVDVTNTGKVVGKESVLLFSKDLVASSTPDNIRLRNFEKVSLKPGETKTVTLKLKGSDLAFVGYDGKWRLEKGDFKIKCGDQWMDIVCDQTKVWNTPNKNTAHK